MPAAGQRIKALDFTESQSIYETTVQSGVTNSAYVVGSPEVGVYVTAPTSGKCLVALRSSVAAATEARANWVLEVFEDNSSGTKVVNGTSGITYRLISDAGTSVSEVSNDFVVSGLTAGQIYYFRGKQKAETATNVTFYGRGLSVMPLPA